MLKLSFNVSDVFPKVHKLSSEVSECKPLLLGATAQELTTAAATAADAPTAVEANSPDGIAALMAEGGGPWCNVMQTRGLHPFMLELNLSNSRTRS